VKSRVLAILSSPAVGRAAINVAVGLFSVVVGVAAFSAAARGELGVGPARLEVAVSPSVSPLTVVELPPFGSVEAVTHKGPIRLVLRLQEIDVVGTKRMLEGSSISSVAALGPEAADGLPLAGLSSLLWTMLGGGALAAALAASLVALAFRQNRAFVATVVALAVLLPVASVGLALSLIHI